MDLIAESGAAPAACAGRKTRIYLAGPIGGASLKERLDAFAAAGARLAEMFAMAEIVNPMELNMEKMRWTKAFLDPCAILAEGAKGEPALVLGDGWTRADCFRADLKALADCDAVALMPGWRDSEGARIEESIARYMGMPVIELPG